MDYQTIKLLGNAEVMVDMDERRTSCRKCGELIRWAITKSGKKMPIILKEDKWQSHFADCEFADKFRKTKVERRILDEQNNQEYLNNL
jgi:hypothetical protein